MNDLVKMANIAKVKANLAAGMPMMAAIKKAYPDYTPDQVKALAAQMGGMGKTAAKGKAAREILKSKKTREGLEEAVSRFLGRGGRIKKMPPKSAEGAESMSSSKIGGMGPIPMIGRRPGSTAGRTTKMAGYGKSLKTHKAKKYMKKKKLAHALMLKIANPAYTSTMPKNNAPKPPNMDRTKTIPADPYQLSKVKRPKLNFGTKKTFVPPAVR